jgi:dTDP-4-dehydrorhamnose 3,5-epimerase
VTYKIIKIILSKANFKDFGNYYVELEVETNWYRYVCFTTDEAVRLGLKTTMTSHDINAISSDTYSTVAKRPINSRLDTTNIENTFILEFSNRQVKVAAMHRSTSINNQNEFNKKKYLNMKVNPLSIPDILLIEPNVFEDSRGFFFESFREDSFKKETSLNVSFVQDNHSKSSQGVLRGLHYQLPPHAQGKLTRVIQGEVLDIAVDIRESSPTFGQYVAEILSSDNKKQLYIPEGFAHGFLTLSKTSEYLYKTTNFYHPKSECCIIWNDTTLNIDWPKDLNIRLSAKDLLGQSFKSSELFPSKQ